MFNPIADNRFENRDDAQRAVVDLLEPLTPWFSDGRGRLRLGATGAHFHEAAADLEGLARPLWGLAPLIAGGGSFAATDHYVEGLANGADPAHRDYWGPTRYRDQRIVESAAIGFAIALAPQTFWDGLPGKGRDHLARWLVDSLSDTPAPNNWHFFHVLVSLGLDRAEVPYDRSIIEADLDYLESCRLEGGWYRDGQVRRAEHYIPFAMHYYGLIHAALGGGHGSANEQRRERFRAEAMAFAPSVRHWFASDGAALPYGRSLTYRFAHAGFWGALAFADLEALPWEQIRGYWARNLRYWARQPMCDRDGIMPVGYAYPNLLMSEAYNSPGSPYWAMKAFLPLALGDDHAFWQAEEADPDPEPEVVSLPVPGMLKWEVPGNLTVLSGGQQGIQFRQGPEKYSKFAYSTRYGFSVENDTRSFPTGPFDSMLAFSDDGHHYRVRMAELDARSSDEVLYSRWSPMSGVEVETWLLPRAPWHLRIHRIVTAHTVQTCEGGFCVQRDDSPPVESLAEQGLARVATDTDVSILQDLNELPRDARIRQAAPNTNVLFPRTWVPQLAATLEAGTHWFACAAIALQTEQSLPPAPGRPNEDELIRLRESASTISVFSVPDPW